MRILKVNVVARNPKHEELATKPMEALVDTGSELTWLPAEVLRSVGISPSGKRIFATATQQKIEREVGYAILRSEGFGVMVDNIGHRFVATTTIVAIS